ncbi:MAG TPA: EAL domain-containing protein, partial [Steroidobacteraceae bacterium]|nr:EAL domain-containing protein [Steroidobacteraceae bacterium]
MPPRAAADARHLRHLLDGIGVFAGICTVDGVLLEGNLAAFRGTGFRRKEMLGKRLSEIPGLWPSPEDRAVLVDALKRARRGEVVHRELAARLATGRTGVIDTTFSPQRDSRGRIQHVVLSGVDVSARKAAESALLTLNRSLRVLSACSAALTRATDEQELLRHVCQLIVDTGRYRFAWVGYVEDDDTYRVRPMAHAGHEDGYLTSVQIAWDESPRGRGPTGNAIRSGKPQRARWIEREVAFEPWRSESLKRGYASSIAIPLLAGRHCIGALNIYSAVEDDFRDEEELLLAGLAADLAYGIEALRTRVRHQRAESRLQTFRGLLDRTNDLVYVIDAASGAILDANDAVSRRLGYSRGELLKMKVTDFSVSAAAAPWPERLDAVRVAGSTMIETQHRSRNGELVPVEVSLSYVEQEEGRYLVSVARDITERKRQQEVIARLGRLLRMQSAINAAVLRIADRDELLQEACRIAVDVGGFDRAVVSIVNDDGRSATPRFSAGPGADFPVPERVEISDGDEPDKSLTSRALRTGKIEIVNDLTQSEPPISMRAALIRLGFKVMVALPLVVEGAKIGALMLASRDPNLVRDEELQLLEDIMLSLAFALRTQRQASVAKFLETYDPSTGLARRMLFCQRVDGLLHEGRGAAQAPAVGVVDIHQLSHINDSFGRRFGDLLLQAVAERLKGSVRNDDCIGRLGGGTFALLQFTPPGSEESLNLLLDGVFGEPFAIEGRTMRVSCRSGVARFPTDGRNCSTLLEKAEAALKRAKDTGEQYLHYQLEMHSELAAQLSLEHRLRNAIDQRQFTVHYQPQLGIRSGRIESVEALLRWNEPTEGLLAPGAFLRVLESSGLIINVGHWVLEQVARDCELWHSLGAAPLRVAVNVSALQLRRRDFVARVLGVLTSPALTEAGFHLDLEITESALLQDLDGTNRKLRELRAAGIRVALDDFGTGYSSLGLLSKLPVDSLKIDRSFVTGLPDDAASISLTSSIISLAAAFRLVTVAEGVETRAQLAMLRKLRCDQWQGYLHSRPV